MTGKLKTKGNIMLATKLDGVLKVSRYSSYFLSGSLHSHVRFLSPLSGCKGKTVVLYDHHLYYS